MTKEYSIECLHTKNQNLVALEMEVVESMGENVCCPLLEVIECGDTEEHNHLYCDPHHTIEQVLLDNNFVKMFCLGNFVECKYFPKGE